MIKIKLIILVLGLAFTGCVSVANQEVSTTSEQSATVVPASSTVSASPRSDIPTGTIEGLSFPEARIESSLLLSEGKSVSCQLPCWHGLEIGLATEQDIQREMGDTFEAEEGFDFFPPPDIEGGFSERLLVSNTLVGGYYWYIEKADRLGSYFLFAYLDDETGRLLGIQERLESFETYNIPLLKDVVAKIGNPEWVYGSRLGGTYSITLYYPEGIIANVDILMDEDLTATADSVCLNDQPLSTSIRLVEPYSESGEVSDSLLHGEWGMPQHPAPYIDEMLGDSIEEFIEFLNSDNPCIEVPR